MPDLALDLAPFLTPGSTTPRSFGERAAEHKNVRDFGAKGNDIDDDTAAIQRAYNSTTGNAKGKVFFPPGKYKTSAPITFNDDHDGHSVIFEGVGNQSQIIGNVGPQPEDASEPTAAGYVLDRRNTNPTPGINIVRDLWIINRHARGGGVRMRGVVGTAVVENCGIGASIGVNCADGNSWTVRSNRIWWNAAVGSVGIIGTNGCSLLGNDITAFDHGIRLSSVGNKVGGGRIEVCRTGIMVGMGEEGESQQSTGFAISGLSMESNLTGIELYAASGGLISGIGMAGFLNAGPGGATPSRGVYCHGSSYVKFTGVVVSGDYSVAQFDTNCHGGNAFECCVANLSGGGGVKCLLPAIAGKVTFNQSPTLTM